MTRYPISQCADGHCKCYTTGITRGPEAHAHLYGKQWQCCFCGSVRSPGACIVCGATYTGLWGLQPCTNGHSLQEEIAYANQQLLVANQDFNLAEAEEE